MPADFQVTLYYNRWCISPKTAMYGKIRSDFTYPYSNCLHCGHWNNWVSGQSS